MGECKGEKETLSETHREKERCRDRDGEAETGREI